MVKPFLLSILACASTAFSGTVINFDNIDVSGGPIILSNQYVSSNVLFQEPDPGCCFQLTNITFGVITVPSPPNWVALQNLNPDMSVSTAIFDIVSDGGPAATDSLSLSLPGLTCCGNFDGITISVYDYHGDLLESQVVPPESGTLSIQTVTFNDAGIHEVQFSDRLDSPPGAIGFDNLTLGDITPVPEPGSALLLFGGMVSIWRVTRRKLSR